MGCGTSRPKAEGLVGTGLAGTGSNKRNQVEPAPSHDAVEEFESPLGERADAALADAALADAALAKAAADAALAKARPMLYPGFKGSFGIRDVAMGTGDVDDPDDLDTFELDEGGGVRKIATTKAGQKANSTMKEAHRLADEAAGHIANIKTILDHDSLSTLPSLPDSSAAAQQDEDPKAAKQRAKLEAKEEKKRAKEEAKRLKAEAKARKKKEKTGRGGGDGDDDDARAHGGGSEVVAPKVALTFDYFDPSKSGFLGYRELRNALRHHGLSNETIRDAKSVLRRYDDTPDGKLDLHEFTELVRDLVAPDDSDDEQIRIDVGGNDDDGKKKKKKVRRPEHRQPQPFAHLVATHRPTSVCSLRMDDAKCMLIASSAC